MVGNSEWKVDRFYDWIWMGGEKDYVTDFLVVNLGFGF